MTDTPAEPEPGTEDQVPGVPDFEATRFDIEIGRLTEDMGRITAAIDTVDIALLYANEEASVIDLGEWGDWSDWTDLLWDSNGPKHTAYEYDDGDDRNQGSVDIDKVLDPNYDPEDVDWGDDDEEDDLYPASDEEE
jgi:hypothetical protein